MIPITIAKIERLICHKPRGRGGNAAVTINQFDLSIPSDRLRTRLLIMPKRLVVLPFTMHPPVMKS